MKHRTRTRTIQPRVEGGRAPAYAGLDPNVEKALQKEIARFNVSGAFIISVALAEILGVKLAEEEDYRLVGKRK
jgi:hypothetical protein